MTTPFAEAMRSYPDCKEHRNLAIARTFIWLCASIITVAIAAVFRKRGHARSLAVLTFFCFLLFVAGAIDWARYKTTLCVCRARPSPIEPWALAFFLIATASLVARNLVAACLLSIMPVIALIVIAVASHPFGGHVTSSIPTLASFLRSGTSGAVGVAGASLLIVATLIVIVYTVVRIFHRSDRTLAVLALAALLLALPATWYTLARSRYARSIWTWCEGPVTDKLVFALLLPLLAVTMLHLAAANFNRHRSAPPSIKASSLSSSNEMVHAPAEQDTVARQDTASPAPVTRENTGAPLAPATRQSTAAPVPVAPVPAPATRKSTAAPVAVTPAPAPATRQSTAATVPPTPATRQSTAAPVPV